MFNKQIKNINSSEEFNSSSLSTGMYGIGFSGHYGFLVVFNGYYKMHLYMNSDGSFKKRMWNADTSAWVGDTF